MKIILSSEEYDFLIRKDFLQLKFKNYIINAKKNSDANYLVEIDEKSALELREECGDQLVKHGFDENYNPTNEGCILENLIDKFYVP